MAQKNVAKVKRIIKRVYDKDACYHVGRWMSDGTGYTGYFGLEFKKKDYPDECPDVARITEFLNECKATFGQDCPQTKAIIFYSHEQYYLLWKEAIDL